MKPVYVILILGIALLIFIVLAIFIYRYAKKRGVDQLMQLFIKSAFEQKQRSFRSYNKNAEPNGIVFIGDSITQDYNVYEYFPNRKVYNRGIGGDTSLGLLSRLDTSVFDLNPKTVVLLIGTNDFGLMQTTADEVAARIKEIVTKIQQRLPKTRIILESVYPVNPTMDGFSVGQRNNQNIKELNEILKTIPGVTYLDLYSLLIDETGNFNPKYTLEGLHASPDGYEFITSILNEYLDD
ncbi:MAG: lysophospholipase [Acholeplasmataceae bacterium]|nr:lysophospholipase [Acholeplasmataceae bacterium]